MPRLVATLLLSALVLAPWASVQAATPSAPSSGGKIGVTKSSVAKAGPTGCVVAAKAKKPSTAKVVKKAPGHRLPGKPSAPDGKIQV